MTIHSHISILKNAVWFVALCTVVLAVGAFFFALTRPTAHVASLSFEVDFVNRPDSADYQYGGYYEQKASEVYTQHIMSIFQSPTTVAEIEQKAGLDTTNLSAQDLTSRFSVKQHSNQNFVVDFSDVDFSVTQRLASSVIAAVDSTVASSGKINQQQIYQVTAATPFFYDSNKNPWMAGLVGAIIGLLGSVVLVYIREYFRQ